ncbi:MAG: ABC transporter permease [Clostridia bacterium]|nr:ABC transporter permease [Clostridia bacterium]
MFTAFLQYSIRYSTVFLFGCTGEIIMEKSGHLNLGVPGIMCAGTAGGCLGVSLYMNALPVGADPNYLLLILIGILSAVVFGAFLGAIYAFLTVTLHCNQNITGLALTTFGGGFTQFIMDNYVNKERFNVASTFVAKYLPFANELGDFGTVFLSYGLLVYLAIIIAIVTSVFLKKTKAGLNLRSIGENPATADATGINVNNYKYLAILIGSGIAGIGGFFFTMDISQGAYESYTEIEALGWLSIALVIFTVWRPVLAILGSILFGALTSLPNFIRISDSTSNALVTLIPYVVTVLVLIVLSITGSKNVQPPASLGLNYFREDR